MQQAPNNVGDVLKQLQGILTRQPPGIGGPLVTIGGPILLAGGGNTTNSVSAGNSRSGSVQVSATRKTLPQPSYSYKVKIINPARKSDVIVLHLNDCSIKFESVTALRVKLIESFRENVPNTIDFNV